MKIANEKKRPAANAARRYSEVAEASGSFTAGALETIWGSELQQILLDHLLALSMPKHPFGDLEAGELRAGLLNPQKNPSYARAGRPLSGFAQEPGDIRDSHH